ncbi:MAG TPA: hypothetical protein VMS65_00450, partial [Polyangiaceae bacterium]|nr:hypothetical protein [Polyangiaceae bacterium]
MGSQHIGWIAVPNGQVERDDGRFLKLALCVAPRLVPARGRGKLAEFPDWLDWTRLAQKLDSFTVEVDGSPPFHARPSRAPVLDPLLWPRLFTPTLAVQAFTFDDYSKESIVSFPASDLATYVKQEYQTLVFDSANALPSVRTLADSLRSFAVALSPHERARVAEDLRSEQAERSDVPGLPRPRTLPVAEAVARALVFHDAPPAEPADLPSSGAELEALFDFHRAIAQLGDYGELMRRLGLVLDIEVPAAALTRFSPAAAPLRIRCQPEFRPDAETKTTQTPLWVAFVWDGKTFAAAPRPSAFPALKDGLLNLPPDEFDLVEFDVDGAVLKLASTAVSLARS